MKRISRMRHWRADVLSSFERAAKLYDKGDSGLDDWRELYRLAPVLAARNRGVSNSATLREMSAYAIEGVKHPHQLEPKNKDYVLFHFTSAYIDSHVAAGLVGELEADKIMDYLNNNIDLFPAA